MTPQHLTAQNAICNQEHDEYKQKVMEQDLELQDLKRRLDRLEGRSLGPWRASGSLTLTQIHACNIYSNIYSLYYLYLYLYHIYNL